MPPTSPRLTSNAPRKFTGSHCSARSSPTTAARPRAARAAGSPPSPSTGCIRRPPVPRATSAGGPCASAATTTSRSSSTRPPAWPVLSAPGALTQSAATLARTASHPRTARDPAEQPLGPAHRRLAAPLCDPRGHRGDTLPDRPDQRPTPHPLPRARHDARPAPPYRHGLQPHSHRRLDHRSAPRTHTIKPIPRLPLRSDQMTPEDHQQSHAVALRVWVGWFRWLLGLRRDG